MNRDVCVRCRHYQGTDDLMKKGWSVCHLCGAVQGFKLEDNHSWTVHIKVVDMRKPPPENCLYAVEHVVSMEKQNAE
jgi:hypothetical protein